MICLQQIIDCLTTACAKPRGRWKFGPIVSAGPGPVKPYLYLHHRKQEADVMITIPAGSKMQGASVGWQDSKGNASKVDGAPVWTVSDPAILSLVVAADGMSADIVPVGPVGTAQVKVEADADMGAGFKSVVLLTDAEVIAGETVAGTFNPGPIVPQ